MFSPVRAEPSFCKKMSGSRLMRLHPLHFGLPQASIQRMRQQPKKQLYLFQFLLECSFLWMYITSNIGNRLLPEKR